MTSLTTFTALRHLKGARRTRASRIWLESGARCKPPCNHAIMTLHSYKSHYKSKFVRIDSHVLRIQESLSLKWPKVWCYAAARGVTTMVRFLALGNGTGTGRC